MKYKTGFLNGFIRNKWQVDTGADSFTYTEEKESGEIYYIDIDKIQISNNLLSTVIRVDTFAKKSIQINSLSNADAFKLFGEVLANIKEAVIQLILNNRFELTKVSNGINDLLKEDRYLSNADIRKWLVGISDIGRFLTHPYYEASRLPSDLQESIKVFTAVSDPKSNKLKSRNAEFVVRTIKKYEVLFSKVEKYPLSEEQQRAAVINEDRNLLIAAAGSGKSSTIVGKTVYLIESGLAKPSEILVLVYNSAAQADIDKRLKDLIGITEKYNKEVKAKTFHSFGKEIITTVQEYVPAIGEMAEAKTTHKRALFQKMLSEIAQSIPTFIDDWVAFLTTCKKPTPDLESINSMNEYNNYLKELGARWKKSKEQGFELVIDTLDGKEVKSMEELRIANWLVLNGVEYEYERPYVHHVADASHRQYYPDFYYPEADLYHEHFALDKNEIAPKFMKDYKVGVIWKRDLHQEKETMLIETHSAHFRDGTVFEKLRRDLKLHNITFKPRTLDEINEIIKKSFNPERDVDLFTTFLAHFKSNNTTISALREKSRGLPDRVRSNYFLNLFDAIFTAYQNKLSDRKEIDFNDQINYACDFLESGEYKHPYKYILIDEFQDLSQDKKRMVNGLLVQDEYIKLFAVGDDWQSIYRFAGADIDIMTHFAHHFGVTSENYLTKTYRSYRGIVDVAAEFVQANPQQLKKTVTSDKDVNADLVRIRQYETDKEHDGVLEQTLASLNAIGEKQNLVLDVYLLSRYLKFKPSRLTHYIDKYSYLNIEFKSIHQSKGLQCDYMILLHVQSEYYSFPSTITDDPLLDLVIPRPESYLHAEERRLLYVALTRAKRVAFILSSKSKRSSFVTELVEMNRVASEEGMARKHPCLKCDTGDMTFISNGKYGPYYQCQNRLECDFRINKQKYDEKIKFAAMVGSL